MSGGILGGGFRIRKVMEVISSLGVGCWVGSIVWKVRDKNLKCWGGGEFGGRNRLVSY